jgi:phospholipid/cholesterol/gamma-HCH transport system substrate-binding protein
MSKRANPTVIGIFVLVAVALAVTGILALGGLRVFREEMTWVAFFDQDVSGLSIGSPVLFRGAQIGQVSVVKIILDPQARIAAYLEVDPRRGPKSTPLIRTQKELQPAIDKGLRAQLRIVSFVTGQLSVSLDFLPHMPVILTGLDPAVPEVPTVPTQLAQYQARLERMLDALDQVDIGQLAQDVGTMVRGIDGVARSPELAGAIRSAGDAFRSADVTLRHMDTQVAAVGGRAGAALDAARELVRKVDREVDPLAASVGTAFGDAGRLVRNVDREVEPVAESLRTALDAARDLMRKVDGEIDPLVVDFRKALHSTRTAGESAQDALAMVTRALDGETRLGDDLSQALRQLAGAARSLNVLADYLQRHPEALLRGKEGREGR